MTSQCKEHELINTLLLIEMDVPWENRGLGPWPADLVEEFNATLRRYVKNLNRAELEEFDRNREKIYEDYWANKRKQLEEENYDGA